MMDSEPHKSKSKSKRSRHDEGRSRKRKKEAAVEEEEDEWVEKPSTVKPPAATRDSWMVEPTQDSDAGFFSSLGTEHARKDASKLKPDPDIVRKFAVCECSQLIFKHSKKSATESSIRHCSVLVLPLLRLMSHPRIPQAVQARNGA